MSSSVKTAEDVLNLALTRIGYKIRVNNFFEGSPAARLALTIYAQTRDQMLSDGNWEFAERNIAPTLLKQAPVTGYFPPNAWSPAFPALPWQYSYSFPLDCLKVRAVKPAPVFLPDFDPRSYTYSVDNDNSFTPPQRVILCNIQNMILVYTGQITDPASMDVAFVEALAAEMGKRLAPALVGLNAERMEEVDQQMEMDTATRTQE